MILYENSDLLLSDCNIICHQINCTSTTWSGFAKVLFEKYPETNLYSNPKIKRDMGKVYLNIINKNLTIIHLAGQRNPGKVDIDSTKYQVRKESFKMSLEKLAQYCMKLNPVKITKIGFPYLIGCGLAGGIWDEYFEMLLNFETNLVNKNNNFVVELHKL